MNNLHDLVGAYVLDALPEDERREYEAHLASCPDCRRELAELRQVVDVLPLAAPLAEPPAEMRDRLLAAVRGEVAEPDTVRPAKVVSLRRPSSLVPWMAIAAALVIATLGLWNIHLQQQLNHEQTVVAALQRENHAGGQLDVALASGATVAQVGGTPAAPAASAAVVTPRNGVRAYLVVTGLPATPHNKVYQLWLVKDGTPTSAGIFTYSGAGPKVIPISQPVSGHPLVAVTIEPGPSGSPGPTGAKVLIGKVA